MAQNFAKKFYNSKSWKSCRFAYIKHRVTIDGGMCETCHEELGYIVHHKIQLTPNNINDPDITLNWCMLRYDCKACHDREEGHFIDSLGIKQLKCLFDSNGQPIVADSPHSE